MEKKSENVKQTPESAKSPSEREKLRVNLKQANL